MLGTPTKETWPEFVELKYAQPYFPGFPGGNLEGIVRRAFNSSEFTDLMQRILVVNPYKRPTAGELLEHSFFSNVLKPVNPN